jgi:hypothetical protein
MNKLPLLGAALFVATGAVSAQTEVGIALGARSPYSLSCSSGTPCDRSADWDRLPIRFSNTQKSSLNLFSLGVIYKF